MFHVANGHNNFDKQIFHLSESKQQGDAILPCSNSIGTLTLHLVSKKFSAQELNLTFVLSWFIKVACR